MAQIFRYNDEKYRNSRRLRARPRKTSKFDTNEIKYIVFFGIKVKNLQFWALPYNLKEKI